MYKFSTLLKDLPTLHENRMSAPGYAVWIVWAGELTEAIPSTFRDYGGIEINAVPNQAVWYFWSTDVFRAAARLQVWANLNDLPVFIQIISTTLMVGFQQEMTLSIPSELFSQQAMAPDEFQVWVHPSIRPDAEAIPGIKLLKVDRHTTGMASAHWHALEGDSRIGFKSTLGWYYVLRPLGNPLDKQFSEGWPKFFAELEKILKRLKLKFILHNNALIFELDNFKALLLWCREILSMIRMGKDTEDGAYWPSVMVAVEKVGYQFNEDLPKKIPLDWDKLAPDFPHMSYRSAYLLGERFSIKDISYSFERNRLTDWCYVLLADYDAEEDRGSLAISLPVSLLMGEERPCFYCGLRSHTEPECPSRKLVELNPQPWKEISETDLKDINEGLVALGEELREDPKELLAPLLNARGPSTTMLQAVFEINAMVQLRTLPLIWRSHGKHLPGGLNKLLPVDDKPYFKALDAMLSGDSGAAEQEAKQGALRNPREYHFRTLQGFLALERGDLDRALDYWREAEPLGDVPMHFAYHKFLQGRGLEVQGRFDQAMTFYRDARKLCPQWQEPLYRQAVSMVKMGFSEHAVGIVDQLVDENANLLNRVLIDPEMERGYVQILVVLYSRWVQSAAVAKESTVKLKELSDEVEDWFGADHEFTHKTKRQVSALMQFESTDNYVAFHKLTAGRVRLAKALRDKIDAEIRTLSKQADYFRARLKVIHENIAWFPFPKALREFNKDFNYCVTKLNWVKQQHFKVAKNFRMSHEYFKEVDDKLGRLGNRLVTLKIVRDATLFVLLLGKSFMWLEIIGLGLALLSLPLGVFVAEKWQIEWISQAIEGQRWDIQKGLVVVVSVGAFAISLLRTALVFEKKKAKFFEDRKELERKYRAANKVGKGRRG